MRYLPAPLLAAGPAFAHPGAHMHPHSVEGWLGVLACGIGAWAAVRARKGRR